MMLSGKFFLLTLLSLILYSCYINAIYVNLEQERCQVYLYDPYSLFPEHSDYITSAGGRQELEAACADRMSVGIDCSGGIPEIYMLSSGMDTMDRYRAAWAWAAVSGTAKEEAQVIGLYNKEQKSRREITAEFLFFELSAVGFLGLASLLFKEKQMGVIRVHGILPVNRAAFILSKLGLFLASDMAFAVLLAWINIGLADSLSVLPPVLLQAGILSLIMALIGFLCAVRLSDFKRFSLFYLVLAVFVTTPVFLAGQTGAEWKWISYHPMYHLFHAMKSAFFGTADASPAYYICCLGAAAVLFGAACRALASEMAREG